MKFNPIHNPTIGVDFISTNYNPPNSDEKIAIKIWDTAGQERFRTITYSFYKQAEGVFIAFDITNAITFTNVKMWLDSLYLRIDPTIPKVLIGNKLDLVDDRKVTFEEA